MKQLFKEHIKDHINIAVGVEEGKWYVQTTDTSLETYYAEKIEDGLNSKEEALAIANHYAKKYDLDVIVWDKGDQPNLYVYFHCDQWKMHNSMRLGGVYTDFETLKERIVSDYERGIIEVDNIESIAVDNIDAIQYAHIETVKPNETL